MRKNPDSMNVAMNVKKFFRRITKLFTKSSSDSTSNEKDLEQIAAQEQKHFSYETLSRATDNFNLDRKLGEGGFGPVYKGKLDDGRETAEKKLLRTSKAREDGVPERSQCICEGFEIPDKPIPHLQTTG